MKKFTHVSLSIALSAMLLSACGTLQQQGRTYTVTAADGTRKTVVLGGEKTDVAPSKPKEAPKPSRADKADNDLTAAADSATVAGDWTIYSVRDNLITSENRPYFTFDIAARRFYGSNGCNILNGDVTLKRHREIRFDNVIATLKKCADVPFEYLINLAVNDVRSFAVRHVDSTTFLDLKNANGNTIMVLRRHNMEFLNGAWSVKTLEGKPVGSVNATIVIDIPELKIHGKGGCNTFNGNLLIDPDKDRSMQFQNIRATRTSCPDLEFESRYFLALENVESAALQPDGTVTMYDGNHSPILTLAPLSLK